MSHVCCGLWFCALMYLVMVGVPAVEGRCTMHNPMLFVYPAAELECS